jgi:hypothetical protein
LRCKDEKIKTLLQYFSLSNKLFYALSAHSWTLVGKQLLLFRRLGGELRRNV